jgi:hypothetical protein
MKIVVNACHGGFGLSPRAKARYLAEKNCQSIRDLDIPRDDPVLVKLVEELGDEAGNLFAELRVVEIPDDVNWYIEEYDGLEWVAERHRRWYS